jgi:thiol-disulfide isomerase/thioredoxin
MPDLATRIRTHYEDAAHPVTVDEILDRAGGDRPVRPLLPYRQPRLAPRWLYAPVAALIVVLVVGGLAWLLRAGDSDTPPATRDSEETVETFLGIPTRPLASFVASIAGPFLRPVPPELEGRDGPGRCGEGECSRLSLAYDAETGTTRLELFDDIGSTNAGSGSYIVSDGRRSAVYLAGANVFVTSPEEEFGAGLGEFAWEWWVDICSGNREEVGDQTIAGRPARGYVCSQSGPDVPDVEYQLWVDVETGIVLSIAGGDGLEYSPDKPAALIRQVGDYGATLEVTALSLQSPVDPDQVSFEAPSGTEQVVMNRNARSILANSDDISVEGALEGAADWGSEDETGQGADLTGEEAVQALAAVAEGSSPPRLEGVTLDGSTFDPGEVEGRNIAVLFWATWCPPSVDALKSFDTVHQTRNTDAVLLAVLSHEDRNRAKPVIDDLGGVDVTVIDPVLIEGEASETIEGERLDPANSFYASWGVTVCPTVVLVDATGIIVSVNPGARTVEDIESLLAQAGWLK